jgi:DNA replication protein DnaC
VIIPPTTPHDQVDNAVVAESLLDRLINNSHQLLMNGPSYRPHKRPGRIIPQDTATPR